MIWKTANIQRPYLGRWSVRLIPMGNVSFKLRNSWQHSKLVPSFRVFRQKLTHKMIHPLKNEGLSRRSKLYHSPTRDPFTAPVGTDPIENDQYDICATVKNSTTWAGFFSYFARIWTEERALDRPTRTKSCFCSSPSEERVCSDWPRISASALGRDSGGGGGVVVCEGTVRTKIRW